MSITFIHLERIRLSSETPKFMVHIKQLSTKNAFIHNTTMFHFTGVVDAVVKIGEYVKENSTENVVFDCESSGFIEGENLGKFIIKNIKMDYDAMNVLQDVLSQ